MGWLVLAVVLLFGAVGCKGQDCSVGETRCSHVGVEICDGAGHWAELADCREVTAQQKAPWTCCAVSLPELGDRTVHACLPADVCVGADR